VKFVFLTTILLLATTSFSQDWLSKYNESVEFYNAIDLANAKTSAEAALELYNNSNSEVDKNKAAILRQLVLICSESGEITAGISYAKEEIEVLDELSLNNDDYYANALNNLGILYSAIGEHEKAKPVLEDALKISRQYFTEESPEIAQYKGNYAITLFKTGEIEQAEKLFDESIKVLDALEQPPYDFYTIMYEYGNLKVQTAHFNTALNAFAIMEDFYGYDAPNYEYASILIKSGDVLDNLGNYSQAIEKYKKAISNFEAIGEENSMDYSIAQNNLSIDLQRTGKFEEASVLLNSLLAKRNESKNDNPEAFIQTATSYVGMEIRNGNILSAEKLISEIFDLHTEFQLPKNEIYVVAMEYRAQIQLVDKKLDSAEINIKKAIDLAERKGFTNNTYSLYNTQSKIFLATAQYEEAKQAGKQALSLAQKIYGNASLKTAFIQNNLGGIYTEMGNYEQAKKLFASSIPVFEQYLGKNHPEYATAISNYSNLLQLSGQYYKAESLLQIAVEIKKANYGEDNPDYLKSYENLGLLYNTTARYTDALRVFNDVLEQKKSLFDSEDPSIAYTLTNIANVKKQTADYTEAESKFKEAEQILAKSTGKNSLQYASTVNSLALLYLKMGNLDAAKPLFESARQIYESQLGKMSPDYATTLENLSTLYIMDDDIETARNLLEEALEIDKQMLGENHPLYSKTLHNLASIYERTEDFQTAKSMYNNALRIDENIYGKSHPSYASTLYNLAVVEQELENFEQSKEYFEEVSQIRKNILGEDHPDYAYSIYGLASINQRIGDYEAAKSNYTIVINKYLNNIKEYFPALSESEKSAFYGKIKPVFEAYIDFAVDYVRSNQGSEEDRIEMLTSLYDLQLSTKALLLNATNKVRNRILNSGDQELIQLFQDWIALKENIVKSLSLSKEEIEQNNIDIAQMQADANELEKQLSLKSVGFASEFEKEAITWEDVQNKLSENEAAIEIIRIKKNLKNDSILYATLIIENVPDAKPRMTVIANGDELENRSFKNYKNAIIYQVDDKKSYSLFWKKIDEELKEQTSTIYLSADGIYNKINISTLMDESGEYLIDKYNIKLLSNTRELLNNSNSKQQNDAFIFGFPKYNLQKATSKPAPLVDQSGMRYSFGDNISELPGTQIEINNISQELDRFGWRYEKFEGPEASEANIKSLSNPKIFHVATHGFFLEDISIDENSGESISSRNMKYNPLMRSGLLFAGAENTIRKEPIPGTEDGILTAYEAMNLNLDETDLVIMSACETGLGEVKNGEGVYGLQRAFIVAGAENLIMSLWKVNDETTQMLMSGFYKEWLNGSTKSEAFNKSIQNVKNQFSDPYYWGAFVMLGK